MACGMFICSRFRKGTQLTNLLRPQSNPMILSCSVAPVAGSLGADLASHMGKLGSPTISMRTSDSEQSSASVVCMSECASDR